MHCIVSADLAYRTYRDIGIAVLQATEEYINCTFVDAAAVGLAGPPSPVVLAEFLIALCSELDARMLLLDGPQAWKDPSNGLEHCRICERVLHTPAKTGIPGVVKPGNYLPFVAFSVAVFDALEERGWPRFTGALQPNGIAVAVESFPMSAWKCLGMSVLPAKARSRGDDFQARLDSLRGIVPLRLSTFPNHDELQALVAGLGGIGLVGSPFVDALVSGVPPFQLGGLWRQGMIVNPTVTRTLS
jgi:hypothetical protein